MQHRAALAGFALALPVLLTACGGDSGPSSTTASDVRVVDAREARQLIVQSTTVVLDVRTPTEFAAGHVTAARNIDLDSGRFEEEIAGLGRSTTYVVYCKSGNRSAAAVALMKQAGFVDVADAGALSDLTAAGIATTA